MYVEREVVSKALQIHALQRACKQVSDVEINYNVDGVQEFAHLQGGNEEWRNREHGAGSEGRGVGSVRRGAGSEGRGAGSEGRGAGSEEQGANIKAEVHLTTAALVETQLCEAY